MDGKLLRRLQPAKPVGRKASVVKEIKNQRPTSVIGNFMVEPLRFVEPIRTLVRLTQKGSIPMRHEKSTKKTLGFRRELCQHRKMKRLS